MCMSTVARVPANSKFTQITYSMHGRGHEFFRLSSEHCIIEQACERNRPNQVATQAISVYFGSITERTLSAGIFFSTCTVPEGHRTSTTSTMLAAPSPKCTGPALEDAYPDAVDL
jgi:hypothetical protein